MCPNVSGVQSDHCENYRPISQTRVAGRATRRKFSHFHFSPSHSCSTRIFITNHLFHALFHVLPQPRILFLAFRWRIVLHLSSLRTQPAAFVAFWALGACSCPFCPVSLTAPDKFRSPSALACTAMLNTAIAARGNCFCARKYESMWN